MIRNFAPLLCAFIVGCSAPFSAPLFGSAGSGEAGAALGAAGEGTPGGAAGVPARGGGAGAGDSGTGGDVATGGLSGTGGTTGGTGGTGGTTGGTGGATGGTGGVSTGGAPPKPCAGTAGPAMVRVTSPNGTAYCVDSTEVTQQQYSLFFDAMRTQTSGQASVCAWNSTFGWGGTGCAIDPAASPNLPMSCVDWCDSAAYCKWAGKHLCGSTGGGAVAASAATDPAQSEWHNACTHGGTRAYPYGNAYSSACASGSAHTVGSATGCEGGFEGVFDMTGNVWERENSCTGASGAGDCCPLRGGCYGDVVTLGNPLSCGWLGDSYNGTCITRSYSGPNVGFRCCSEAL
jgi:formylglycine-generating enzyme required for sulfatase activity